MNMYEVVTKLIGSIEPIGETQTDNVRLENLKSTTHLVGLLLNDINYTAKYKDRHEDSMKKAGKFADKFISDLGITDFEGY